MKIRSLLLMLLISIVSFGSEPVPRLDRETVREMDVDSRQMRVELLEDRLETIHDMDMKALPRSERKEIKEEFRYIKKELRAHANHGVYISTAGLIIIILLAIIIF